MFLNFALLYILQPVQICLTCMKLFLWTASTEVARLEFGFGHPVDESIGSVSCLAISLGCYVRAWKDDELDDDLCDDTRLLYLALSWPASHV